MRQEISLLLFLLSASFIDFLRKRTEQVLKRDKNFLKVKYEENLDINWTFIQ